mmetsp:Transcript_10442/g.24182  ORF Transcript_10442/g.24182 Transcript_10442/m.24182 type:complete len:273 (-) Transcript_10442:26-844(-)
MALGVDDAIGAIVRELRASRSVRAAPTAKAAAPLWERTLLIFASDNGAPIGKHGSNLPLRAGKDSFFEGGVRAVAAMSGGLITTAARGAALSSVMHVSDWYASLSEIAGIDAAEMATGVAARLPPVDSVSMWPQWRAELKQRANGSHVAHRHTPRVLALASHTLLDVRPRHAYKILNHTACDAKSSDYYCTDCAALGCVFDVFEDPHERHNIAAKNPALLAKLQGKLRKARNTLWADQDPRNQECGVHPPGKPQNFYLRFAAEHGYTIQPYC